MIRFSSFLLIRIIVFQAVFLVKSSISLADPLVVNPPVVDSGSVATVSGPGIQPGARVLVWGGSSLVNTVSLTGNALDVEISGNYAFVAAGNAGVHVVDITDPANASLVASIATAGSAQSISISGNYAYVGGGAGGLEIIDISDPTVPALLPAAAQPGNATDVKVAASYAYVANGLQHLNPARINELDSLVLYVPLNDRINGQQGTNINVPVGPNNLILAELNSGNLVVPSTTYNVEDHFGSNGGTMDFPGGSIDGPLIVGDREDFKTLLNFADSPAIISFWVDNDTSVTNGGTIVSAGPNGSLSTRSGGWSAYTDSGKGKVWFVVARKNHPAEPDCRSITIAGSMPVVADGNRHHILVVYDPQGEEVYLYTDGIKGGIRDLSGCRADSEGDDSGTSSGNDSDWFTIGEAGQGNGGSLFYSGSVQDLYILSPPSIPIDIDAIAREWYTLGMPGPRAASAL